MELTLTSMVVATNNWRRCVVFVLADGSGQQCTNINKTYRIPLGAQDHAIPVIINAYYYFKNKLTYDTSSRTADSTLNVWTTRDGRSGCDERGYQKLISILDELKQHEGASKGTIIFKEYSVLLHYGFEFFLSRGSFWFQLQLLGLKTGLEQTLVVA